MFVVYHFCNVFVRLQTDAVICIPDFVLHALMAAYLTHRPANNTMHKRQQARARIPHFVSIVDHHRHGSYDTIITVSYSMQRALVLVNASTL